jgi:hypothetical protein
MTFLEIAITAKKEAKFTVYTVSVQELRPGEGDQLPSWGVEKRYSDFLELHTTLVRHASAMGRRSHEQMLKSMYFPPKRIYGSRTGKVSHLKTHNLHFRRDGTDHLPPA